MSYPCRRPGDPFTPNQKAHLQGLLAVAAVSRDTAVNIYSDSINREMRHGLNPVVIGALRDRGLAASRSVKRKMRSWTEYWLTPEGVAAAQALNEITVVHHG